MKKIDEDDILIKEDEIQEDVSIEESGVKVWISKDIGRNNKQRTLLAVSLTANAVNMIMHAKRIQELREKDKNNR